PPSALDGLKPLAGGSTPAPGADQSPAGITALLTSKEWRFDGANWSETRVFRADGLMTIDNDARTAHWQIAGDKIVITFKDHKDVLFLPLDPKGTKGQGGYGRLFIATQVTEAAPAPGKTTSSQKPAPGAPPGSGAAYFGSTNAYGGSPSPTPTPMPGAPP
ncbi:MAG TPA: hypothetical protein VG733_08785, partial [Chthoniobacteraceae bacterium]|nr:hypothetical protein [Chthoniobacteraceae bacterium]